MSLHGASPQTPQRAGLPMLDVASGNVQPLLSTMLQSKPQVLCFYQPTCVLTRLPVAQVRLPPGSNLYDLLQYWSLDETSTMAKTSKGGTLKDDKGKPLLFLLHLLSELSSAFRNLKEHPEKAEHWRLQEMLQQVAALAGAEGDLLLHVIARCAH